MKKKVYFASDFHLGIDARVSSREREKAVVEWLDEIADQAREIYLVGDVFDFWFEYKSVVPKGFVRLLGKLAELADGGMPIYFFTGNHDMWVFRFFEEELGIPTYRSYIRREFDGRQFLIGHGDGLGPGDSGYKFLKVIFASKVCQWLFARLHPNFGTWMANFWSNQSRYASRIQDDFQQVEDEWLYQFANDYLDREPVDFFVFGHRHIPLDITLKNGKSRYINLGDWLFYNSYAVWDGEDLKLEFFKNPQGKIYGK